MSKKLLILSNMYPGPKSPSYGIFVKNINDMLEESGFSMKRVVIAGRSDNLLLKLWAYVWYFLKALLVLTFTRRTLYVHFVAHSSIPILLVGIFRRFNIVSHVHGGDVLPALYEPKLVRRVKKWVAARTLNRSQCVIVPSNWFKELVSKEFDVPLERIVVNPSGGVDLERFQYSEPQLNSAKPVLGYVGRLDKGKGVDTFVKALEKVESEFECQIVGAGVLEKELHDMVMSLSLDSKVKFLGLVAQKDLPAYYQSFDFMVFPSEMDESLGLVGLESMACGRPVIGSMKAGMADYMLPGENTIAFQAGNEDSLSGAIEQALTMAKSDYHQFCLSSRKTAEKFSSRVSNHNLVETFKAL